LDRFRSDLFSDDYDAKLDPRLTAEFQAAAFRVGHSMVQRTVE
jgi:hypothetical protein